jgi:MoxR-like ATPase
MDYQKYFDRGNGQPQKPITLKKLAPTSSRKSKNEQSTPGGDRRDGLVYVYNETIELAINVALATHRPILIRGTSGSGKSSLARNVARRLKWWYYEQVITSRTQARDLQWSFDTLRRLSDAQANKLKANAAYIEPGVLWWSFDPNGAARRGQPVSRKLPRVENPGIAPPKGKSTISTEPGAVVLLDEIDKADPDVPNNLLVPLGSLQFKVIETGLKIDVVAKRHLLVLITTNDERVLPNAFMRRCVMLELEPPDAPQLVKIAKEHYGPDKRNIYGSIADKVLAVAPIGPPARGGKPEASAAEYLDAVRACMELNVNPESNPTAWDAIANTTLSKKAAV